MNKKAGSFIVLLLLAASFSIHKTHTMEINHQQMLYLKLQQYKYVTPTPEALALFESLCKKVDVDLNFIYPPQSSFGQGMTLLMQAAAQNKCPFIEILLNNGADINKGNVYGITPLMAAARDGSTNAVQCLLGNPLIKIDQLDFEGSTALMFAATADNCPIIQLLLDHGSDINKANSDGITALMIAVNNNRTNAIKCLLNNHLIAINQQNNEGETALMYAILRGVPSTVELLLNAKADPEIPNFHNNTPLQLAQVMGNREIINLIRMALQIKRYKEQIARLKEQIAGG